MHTIGSATNTMLNDLIERHVRHLDQQLAEGTITLREHTEGLKFIVETVS